MAGLSRKLCILAAIAALGPIRAGAYTLTGFRFDHYCFQPLTTALAAAAVAESDDSLGGH